MRSVVTDEKSRKPEDFQFTRPKKGEPVRIPVPTREAFFRDLEKVVPPDKPQPSHDEPADEADSRK